MSKTVEPIGEGGKHVSLDEVACRACGHKQRAPKTPWEMGVGFYTEVCEGCGEQFIYCVRQIGSSPKAMKFFSTCPKTRASLRVDQKHIRSQQSPQDPEDRNIFGDKFAASFDWQNPDARKLAVDVSEAAGQCGIMAHLGFAPMYVHARICAAIAIVIAKIQIPYLPDTLVQYLHSVRIECLAICDAQLAFVEEDVSPDDELSDDDLTKPGDIADIMGEEFMRYLGDEDLDGDEKNLSH